MADFESDDEFITSGDYLKGPGEYDGDRNEEGERHGNGKATYSNGDKYTGQFEKGKRSGTGTYHFKKARYFGDYKEGKRDGNGVMIYPDGSKYSGAWKNGLKDGKGTYTFVNGDEFDGEWQNDLKHGRGRYCYKETGTEFLAKWVEGQQVGTARWVHKDHEYEGHFKEGSPCGRGKYSFTTGCELQGYYVIKDIVQQVEKRMELVGREPVWHAQLISQSMTSKE